MVGSTHLGYQSAWHIVIFRSIIGQHMSITVFSSINKIMMNIHWLKLCRWKQSVGYLHFFVDPNYNVAAEAI